MWIQPIPRPVHYLAIDTWGEIISLRLLRYTEIRHINFPFSLWSHLFLTTKKLERKFQSTWAAIVSVLRKE